MSDTSSTVRSRELGEGLRLAMEHAGFTGKQTAHMLAWSESKVSRLLSGQQNVSELDISAFLAVCMITGPERDHLLKLAREQAKPGWLQQYGTDLPEQLKTLIDHESKAVEIVAFEPNFVPGLLQTGDYARALLERSAVVPRSEIRNRVAARLSRTSVFSGENRPTFTFFLHEFVLRMPVGNSEVMSGQLHHLLQMGVRAYISIRVIPAAHGAHAAVMGSCRLMNFAEFKPVAYIEEQTAGHFLEEPEEIDTYQKIFASLAKCALDEGQSRDLIAELAVELYGDGEDGHDRA